MADALGNPVRLLVTPGQRGDVPFAAALVEGLSPLAVVADTAYDATHFRARLALVGAEAVIPPNPSRALKPDTTRGSTGSGTSSSGSSGG